VRSGVLTPEEAERHPQRSAITRAVGTESAIEADVFAVTSEPGDLYLLCSDGLTDMLGADDIAATIMTADRDPVVAGKALVAAANAEGGEDNITVVLFELVEGEPEAEPEQEPASIDGAEPDAASATEVATTQQDVRTHGAGPGGRLAAIGLIALVLVVGVLVLYWGIKR
jgi:protein phosphatase